MSSTESKSRKHERTERNKALEKSHKEEAWNRGKFIKENHNGGPYSEKYTIELGKRLAQKFKSLKTPGISENKLNNSAIDLMRKYRVIVRDYLLHHSTSLVRESDEDFLYLVKLYEEYQDNPLELGTKI